MAEYILQKDLIKCPAGRIFKRDVAGNYFHSIKDEEIISDDYKDYRFKKDEVENNPDWFIKKAEPIVSIEEWLGDKVIFEEGLRKLSAVTWGKSSKTICHITFGIENSTKDITENFGRWMQDAMNEKLENYHKTKK